MKEQILSMLRQIPGDVSFYYKNLVTHESFALNEHFAHNAASVIKIPVMIEAMRQFESGEASPHEKLPLRDCDRVPPCGVLTFMHEGLEVSLMDLIWLMITISDNMATNMLIERFGVDKIEAGIRKMGLENTTLKRRFFVTDPEMQKLTNRVSAHDMGVLLEKLYRGEVVSESASKRMIEVLLGQQLGKKIPFYLTGIEAAHKTGEITGVTHDVGIVFAAQPFVVCFCSSNVDAPEVNAIIGKITCKLAVHCGGSPER